MGKIELVIILAVILAFVYGRCTVLTPFLGECNGEIPDGSSEFEPQTIRIQETDPAFKWFGNWTTELNPEDFIGSMKVASYNKPINNAVNISFTGSEVKLLYYTCNDCGIINVSIDGEPYPDIDSYSFLKTRRVAHLDSELLYEPHVMTVSPENEKNPESTGYNIIIDGIEVTRPF